VVRRGCRASALVTLADSAVKACLEAKTDYIDLCGEPEFMERMLLEYSDAARDAGAIICHACAFDSVPADLGILHCAQMFERAGGECAHVEMAHSLEAPIGYVAHDTTFKAAVHGIGAARDLVPLRKKLDSKFGKVPRGSKALGDMKRIGAYAKDPQTGKYLVPFIGSDASVVRSSRRTMAHILNNPGSERLMPQFSINFTVGTMYSLAKLALGGLLLQCLATCKCGRDLLCKYPKFFTFGLFSSEGPTLAQMQNNTWIGDFKARGLVQSQEKTLHVQAKLDDPGYIGTSLLFSAVADTILRDRGSLSASGGVFTPAALFAGSSLLSRLKQRGFEFKVVKTDLDLSGGGA